MNQTHTNDTRIAKTTSHLQRSLRRIRYPMIGLSIGAIVALSMPVERALAAGGGGPSGPVAAVYNGDPSYAPSPLIGGGDGGCGPRDELGITPPGASGGYATPYPVYLNRGAVIEQVTDLALPGITFPWSHTRTYDSILDTENLSTTQGIGWMGGLLEAHLQQSGSDIDLYVDASAKLFFDWNGSSFDPPDDYNASLVKSGSGANEIYTLTQADTGNVFVFYGFDRSIKGNEQGRLKERTILYFQEQSQNGIQYTAYNNDGQVTTISTSQGWAISISYTAEKRRQKIEVKDGSSTVVQKVEYLYYDDVTSPSSNIGQEGDLVEVKASRYDSAESDWIVRYTHYRYYLDADSGGSDHQLKAVYESDAIERIIDEYGGISDTEDILQSADTYGTPDLSSFASRTFTYYESDFATSPPPEQEYLDYEDLYGGSNVDETGWVKTETINGACGGCGGGGGSESGQRTYYWTTLGASSSTDDVSLIVIDESDLGHNVFGINDDGRLLREAFVIDPETPGDVWCWSTKMTSDNRPEERRMPSAHTGVDTKTEIQKFFDPETSTNDADTVSSSAGVIYTYSYDSNSYRTATKVKKGTSGTAYYVSATDYGDGTDDEPVHLPEKIYTYATATTTKTNGKATSYTYTFHDSGDTQIKRLTTTLPSISTSQNGSATATAIEQYFDDLGRLRWTKDGEGYVSYFAPHEELGRTGYRMVDVNTSSLDSDITSGNGVKWNEWTTGVPTGFTRGGSLPTALELVDKTEYDDQGRVNKRIDRNGHSHFTVHDTDKTMQFPYWDDTPDEPILPIQVTEYNDGGQVIEVYAVDPDQTTQTGGVPTGFTDSQSAYVSWTKNVYGDDGELSEVWRYHDIPSSGDGTLSTNYDKTIYQYDGYGRRQYVIQTASGTGTSTGVEQVTQSVYDNRSRVTSVKRGVSSSSHNMGSSYTTYPTLATVSASEFDDGDPGDGLVTKSKRYHGTGANDYTGANRHYDWWGRLRGVEPFYHNGSSETAMGPYSVQDVDWAGRVIASAVYDTNLTWASVIADDGWAATTNTTDDDNRRTLTETSYDDLGRSYMSEVYTINSSTGAKGSKHVTERYYDRNNRVVAREQVNGMAAEVAFDGAGRQYQTRAVLELESTKYSSGAFQYRAPTPHPTIGSMTGGDDKVVTLGHSEFDDGGNVTKTTSMEMNHSDTGSPGIDVSNDDDYIQMWVYSWYDDADRLTDTVNYGTNNADYKYYATAPTDTTPPDRSATELRTTYAYNGDTGRLETVTDPAGTVSKAIYDDLGRTIYAVENYANFDESDESGAGASGTDRVTKFAYNGAGQITARTAMDADGDGNTSDNQDTTYLYEDSYNVALNTNIIYPDSSDTTSSGTDQVKLEYNLDGSLSKRTDQRTTVVDYTYTNERNLELQKVTTLGGSTDGHVRSIKFEYDDIGQLEKVTSYSNSDGTGTVRNQIVLEYSDYGAVTKSWQSHEGAKSGGTPNVQYTYDTSDDANDIYDDGTRLTAVTYPDARQIDYKYTFVTSAFDRMNRLDAIGEGGSTTLMSYRNNGLNRFVIANYLAPDIWLNYEGADYDSDYEAFDRFGRVVDQYWADYGGGADADRFLYAYDEVGNRTYRDIDSSIYGTDDKDQKYTYDGLDRLTQTNHGTLSSGDITNANANFRQKWGVDQLGNWADFQEDANGDNDFTDVGDLDQDRTNNDANEITGITEGGSQSAWIHPAYDNAGNMDEGPAPGDETTKHKYVYDAWNRLVEVTDNSDVTIVSFEYDGLNRRIVKTDEAADPDVDYDYYYNEQWQVLEVRKDADTDPLHQYVWHPFYIDALAVTYYDADTDNSGVEELYATFDANMNVTALVNSSGTGQERYEYDSYGQLSILDADFSADADGASDKENDVLFGGYRYDTESGLYHVRNRMLHPSLGRWMQRDPAAYRAAASLYSALNERPTTLTDPRGTVPQDPIPDFTKERIKRLNDIFAHCASVGIRIEVKDCPSPDPACANPVDCARTTRKQDPSTGGFILEICVCVDNLKGGPCKGVSRNELVIEELIHAWQLCDWVRRLNGMPNRCPPPSVTDDYGDMCYEIGAMCNGVGSKRCTNPSDCCPRLCAAYNNFPGIPKHPLVPALANCIQACSNLWNQCCPWAPAL